MKENLSTTKLNNAPIPLRVKGHLKITLTNVKTGEVEVIEKDNMQTDGIAEFLTNCGWMNSDNVTKSNAVKQLLGGILMFDDVIDEDATIVKTPGGLNMVANGACDVSNGQTTGDPSEMGSWVAESDTGSGWKDDGSYHFVWEWGLEQGIGTIASACLTAKDWGHIGEGNSRSDARKPTSLDRFNMPGSWTDYAIIGYPCRLDVEDSSIYGIEIDTANLTATIRKFSLPLTELNLKVTPTEPLVLSETTIAIPQGLADELTRTPSNYRPSYNNQHLQDTGETLVILNVSASTSEWGVGFTQKMWEIDPVAETCTETTLPNLYSGDRTMYSMRFPVFLDKNTVAWINGNHEAYSPVSQEDIIYGMKRTNGTWGSFQSCANTGSWQNYALKNRGSKTLVLGYYPNYWSIMYDFDNNTARKCNFNGSSIFGTSMSLSHDKDLIVYLYQNESIRVYRDESYIATIWNADSPYEKTAEKFMRVDYSVSFEEENTNS